jgi:hypothetical protein
MMTMMMMMMPCAIIPLSYLCLVRFFFFYLHVYIGYFFAKQIIIRENKNESPMK